MDDILEAEPDTVRLVSKHNSREIHSLADRTHQVRTTNRGGPKQDKIMTIDEFRKWLQKPLDGRSKNGRVATWAPSNTKTKQRNDVTNALLRAWGVKPATIRTWLLLAK